MSRSSRRSTLAEGKLSSVIDALVAEVRKLYLDDEIPWVVGYSGVGSGTGHMRLVRRWHRGTERPAVTRTDN